MKKGLITPPFLLQHLYLPVREIIDLSVERKRSAFFQRIF